LCKSTACINTSTDTAYTDIHNSNVPSLGLEQQHEISTADAADASAAQFSQPSLLELLHIMPVPRSKLLGVVEAEVY